MFAVFQKYARENKVAFGLFCAALAAIVFLRFYQLSTIPSSFTFDEMVYLFNAKVLSLTGTDATGQWNPWSLRPFHPWYAEWPSHLIALGMLVLPQAPILSAHLTYSILGLILPVTLGYLSYLLFKKPGLALIVVLVAGINPVLFQFSRLVYDSFPGLVFYVLGITLFVSGSPKAKLVAAVAFTIGFFQYQGYKLLLVPFLTVLTVYEYLRVSENYKRYSLAQFVKENRGVVAVFVTGCLLFALYMLVLLPGNGASVRMSETVGLTANIPDAATAVDAIRKQSLQASLVPLYINKYTLLFENMLYRYLSSFTLQEWFVGSNAGVNYFFVWQHGYFYLLDAVFLAIGLGALLVKKYKNQAFLLVSLIALSPLPEVIQRQKMFWPHDTPSGYWSLFRSACMTPFLIIIISLGIYTIVQYLARNWQKFSVPAITVLVGLYLLLVGRFLTYYFNALPITSSTENLQYRILSEYLRRLPADAPVLVYSRAGFSPLQHIFYYNNLLQKETINDLLPLLQSVTTTYKQIAFSDACYSLPEESGPITVIERLSLPCGKTHNDTPSVTLAAPLDSGTYYTVINDPLCSDLLLPKFVSNTKNNFDLQKLSREEFCNQFVVRY